VRPSGRPKALAWALAWLVVLPMVSLAEARPATLKERAKLRAGAGATSDLLGELPAGAKVEVLGEDGGWRQVQTPEGQVGYVWAEHLSSETATAANPAPHAEASGSGDRSLLDEVRELHADVRALRERPEPATAGDLENLRTEVQRLVTTQEGLTRRLEQHPVTATDPLPEGTPGATPALVLAAAVVGWLASRLTQRRRDFRQRDRLRL